MRRVFSFVAAAALLAGTVRAQEPLDKIGELRLALVGLSASVEPAAPVVPKTIASAVRIVVRAGGNELAELEVARLLGNGFEVQAELSGPGLRDTFLLKSLQRDGEPAGDPLLLPLPPLAVAGDYAISNVRIVVAGKPVLDVAARVPLKVIDQILVTSVKTRPLTLDEIKAKGIVLDKDDYLAFEFTLGVTLNSKPVNFSFPVVFDRDGIEVPQPPTTDVDPVRRQVEAPDGNGGGPMIQPFMLALEEEGGGGEKIALTMPDGRPIRIPSVLVIPGNVGYLKQFFSAQLFVANGAPVGSGLTVRDVTGKVKLPVGPDPTTSDDEPLAFPEIERNGQKFIQPDLMNVRGLGLDGLPETDDDVDVFAPGEQGQAEFLIRGELEGFHKLDFDIKATLEGLPVGPVKVTGKASGAVLVRNPFFDMTFTVPSVVRALETFKLFVTLSNVGKGAANDVKVVLDEAAISGAHLACAPGSTEPWCRENAEGQSEQQIPTIAPGDSKTLEYRFVAEKTGKVSAAYLRFQPLVGQLDVTGSVAFKLGVGDSGIPLSPDTLVLPASVDALPSDVIAAAMRVLGQAWSLANAPAGSLPAGFARTTTSAVTQKAIALAEAGLRVQLRGNSAAAVDDSVRDLILDFFGGSPLDPGFDQVLRKTEAGRALAQALGAALEEPASAAGGALPYEDSVARLAASGPDFVSFAATALTGVELSLADALGRRSTAGATAEAGLPGLALLPLEASGQSVLGVLSDPSASPYTLALGPQTAFAVTIPAGDGSLRRVTGVASFRARIVLDLSRPASLKLEEDADADGTFETSSDLVPETIVPLGPQLLAVNVIGPETLPAAGSFGFEAAVLFDRPVDANSATDTSNYTIPNNAVRSAKRQLTGRLVFAVLALPEGPHVPTTFSVSGLADPRGAVGPAATVPLKSRLLDPGAVVSGRIVSADGAAVPGATTFYANTSDAACPGPHNVGPIAVLPLDGAGRYELRYVRRNSCGLPFVISTVDPVTGNRREVTGVVRNDGERMVLDIALIGRGAVAGTVRTLAGDPVAGAKLLVRSVTDPNQPQNGETDGEGHYRVDNLTVGQVVVEAAKGIGLGRNGGRIFAAGTTATVDVTLDSGAVRVSGRFRKVADGAFTPIARALLSYSIVAAQGGGPAGYTFTDDEGRYAFEGMPVGAFRVSGSGSGVSAFVNGVGQLGDDLQNVDLVYEVPTAANVTFGTVKGFVRLPNGDPAPQGTIVAKDVSGTVIFDGTGVGANGAFQTNGVKVNVQESLGAVTRDGKRRGYTTFTIDPVTREIENVIITLSGLGTAQFTVRDPQGNPLANQSVRLLGFGLTVGGCHDPCGCVAVSTDGQGIAKFEDLAPGHYQVQALRAGPGYMDVARGSASVVADGQTGFGQIQFGGVGTVSGELKSPAGVVLQGGSVALSSNVFVNDGQFTCGLVRKESHAGPIDPSTNKFSFKNVLMGGVSVSATNEFAGTRPVGASGTLTSAGQNLFFSLQLVDTTAGELSGKVFYPDGVTPAGAGVEVTTTGALPEVKVRTDASGSFHFATIFPQGSYSMIARDPATGGVAREFIWLQAQQPLHHDLRLKGTGTVRVRVVDGADEPVSAAFVKLRESDFPNRAFEAPIGVQNLGVASIEGVFEGGFSVEVSEPGGRGGRASGTLPRPGDSVEIKVRLNSTGKVEGHVLMPDATPSDLDNPRVPFAVVTLTAGGRRIGQVTTPGSDDTSTPDVDELGYFTFDFVPAGAVRVEVQDPLTLRSGFATGSIDTEGQLLTLDAKLQGLGTVSGRVTRRDAGGEPEGAGGAHVDLVSGGYASCTFADGTGRYSVSGVPEGRVTVTAALSTGNSLGNFLAATASGTLSGEAGELTLDVALRDSGEVTGQVLRPDEVTPGPISTVQISVGGFGGATQSATTDEQGRFHFERVPAGAATLTVDALGSIDKAKKSFEVPAGSIDVPVPLNGVGPLRGVAFDSSGTTPIAGDVTLTGSGAFPYTEYVKVGSTGQFVWPELLAGPVTLSLRVQQGGLTLYGSASGEVVAGQPNTLDVTLQDTGTVIGVLKREDGVTPAYGTDVTLQRVANGATLALQAQNDGSFMAKGMPLGAFTFRARDPLTGGVALVTGRSVAANGEIVDLETIVLDNSPVAVVSVDPPDGAQGVAVNRPIQIVFTDPLKHTGGVALKNGTAGVGFVPSLSEDKKTLTLTGTWPDARELTLEVGAGVTDIHDRHPAQAFSSRFRTVDLSPPQVTAVTPANQAIQVDPGATVTVTFDEPLSETTNFAALATLSGGVIGSSVLTSPTSVVFTPASPLASNASYSVTVNGALDLSGNQQTAAFTSSFKTVDTIAPALAVTSPNPSVAWVKTLRPPLTVSLSDAGSGIDTPTSELLLDGVSIPNPFRASSFVSFTPASDLAQGPHDVAASVRDRAGNLGSTSGGFSIDTIAPEPAVLTGVDEGAVIQGIRVLGGVASDPAPGSGVTKIEILRGGSLIATAPAPSFAVSYNTNLLSEGPHVLSARAVDVAGNVGPQGPPVNVIVDNKVLGVTITLPAPNTRVRDSVRVTATVTEAATQVEFRIGTLSLVDDEPPYDRTFDLATLGEGSHTVEAIAAAVGGDVAVAPGVSIFLDRTPPPAPVAARIVAEESDPGFSSVAGLSGAVEGGTTVEVKNVTTGVIGTSTAAQDGSFAARLHAVLNDEVDVTAIDSVLNRGPSTRVTVTRTVSPSGVPLLGLALWASADQGVTESGAAVSAVADRSGRNNHLVQSQAGRKPTLVPDGFNGWPVLRFDGSSDRLEFTSRLSTIRTVFWVVSESAQATSGPRPLLGDDTVLDFHGGSGAPGTLWSTNAHARVRDGKTYLNHELVDGQVALRPRTMSVISLVTTETVTAGNFAQDRNGSTSLWWGDLAELLVYERPLSASERRAVEDYLVAKYRPFTPIAGTPGISPSGGVFSGSTTVTLKSTTPGAEIRYTLDGSEPSSASLLYEAPFEIAATTTLRAKASRAGYEDSATAAATFIKAEEFPVLAGSAPRLWWRADAGIATNAGDWVTDWIDQSGHGNHGVPATGQRVPRLVPNAANGLPALRFDGNDRMNFTSRLTTIRTVFWVVKESEQATSGPRLLLGDDTVLDFHGGSGAPGTIWSTNAHARVRDGQTFLNGAGVNGQATLRPRTMSVISLVTTDTVSANNFAQDRGGSTSFWWGDLAELVVYDRELPLTERQAVENYLRTKYWEVKAAPGAASVALSWLPRPGIGVRYDVERSTTSGSGYEAIAAGLIATAYTDASVAPLTTYYYRVVAVDGSGNRFPSREAASSSISAGDGSGLTGTYYGNPNLAGSPTQVRVDELVDFNFGTAAADGVNADNFSVRWTGQLQAPATGDFVFATNSDDGVRLRVNGELVIDNWTDHGDTLNTSAPVRLQVGQRYDIELEYYDRTGGALIRLRWAYPGQTVYQTIPKAQLHP